MTILQVIRTVDEIKPNSISQNVKMLWLNEIESKIKKEIIDTHTGCECNFVFYNETTDTNTNLIASEPYDNVYVYFLCAKIDFSLSEIDRYNNDMIMFNAYYRDYQNYINRTYLPKNIGQIRV